MTVLAVVGGATLAAIGFTGSYAALRDLGEDKGLGRFAYVFPIGLDAGIVVLLALDLLLIRRRTPWPVLRLLAHTFTLATVWFNASSGDQSIREDPVGAGMHGVIPLMFIAAVEAGRRLIIRMTALEDGRERPGVPLHRWILAPIRTFAMWRRMRLWDVPTYAEAVAREQALTVYRVMLERKHGSARKAPADARLPLTMAPYGLTIDEALALPQEATEREQRRREAEADRIAAEEQRAQDRAAALERSRIRAAGSVTAARHEVEGETHQVQARAAAAAAAAERAARAEAEAEETAAAAAAKARAAADERRAADDRKAAAETAAAAAEIERAAAETRRLTANEDDRTAAAEARAEEARATAARSRKAAAEAEAAAAEIRHRAAEIELRAVELEDAARLSPRERTVRRLARQILAAGGDPEALRLEEIAETYSVSMGTASAYRQEAGALLTDGYRPGEAA
ncbi:DUF2637 domain-containing protein [Streptomyces sp. S07_1.15]|uniref:DUF2637 domain-containing protein n=1 Tax=Streptomyces sp. S07_1.15 TaxID=2873925 RepID=UPI001D153C6F|nr:DUF2637 domain-containing protein [Streptomyces sp. S07_1.15]MCC3654736.1 DUF2637 domain-containing protein [Streptomyces sp. S07_1.15]